MDQAQEIESIRVPVANPKVPGGIGLESYPILYPHRIVSYLWEHIKLQVRPEEVQQYWEHARAVQEPWALGHKGTSQHIPLGLHGDAAKTWTEYKFEKVVGVFLNVVLFRPRSTRHSRYLLFSCPNEKLVKNRTLNTVFNRLVWSFDACFDGVHPMVCPNGGPLFGKALELAGTPLTSTGAKFALTELRGDWEWHVNVWRPNASWLSTKVCFKCPCEAKGDPAYLYYNSGPTCAWKTEEFTLEQFISRRLPDRNLCDLT